VVSRYTATYMMFSKTFACLDDIPIFLTFWIVLLKMHNIHFIIYPTQFVWGFLSYYSISQQHTGRKWSGSSKSIMQLWCKGPQRNERRARWGNKICDLDLCGRVWFYIIERKAVNCNKMWWAVKICLVIFLFLLNFV